MFWTDGMNHRCFFLKIVSIQARLNQGLDSHSPTSKNTHKRLGAFLFPSQTLFGHKLMSWKNQLHFSLELDHPFCLEWKKGHEGRRTDKCQGTKRDKWLLTVSKVSDQMWIRSGQMSQEKQINLQWIQFTNSDPSLSLRPYLFRNHSMLSPEHHLIPKYVPCRSQALPHKPFKSLHQDVEHLKTGFQCRSSFLLPWSLFCWENSSQTGRAYWGTEFHEADRQSPLQMTATVDLMMTLLDM